MDVIFVIYYIIYRSVSGNYILMSVRHDCNMQQLDCLLKIVCFLSFRVRTGFQSLCYRADVVKLWFARHIRIFCTLNTPHAENQSYLYGNIL
jgi:hypothetical protein